MSHCTCSVTCKHSDALLNVPIIMGDSGRVFNYACFTFITPRTEKNSRGTCFD